MKRILFNRVVLVLLLLASINPLFAADTIELNLTAPTFTSNQPLLQVVGLKLPSSPFDIIDEIDGIGDKLQNEGDMIMGLNPQVLNAQVGINASFLLDNLYLGLKFGFMNLDIDPVSFGTFNIGALGNYQILPGVDMAGGLLRWRGVNVGTGFIYQRTTVGIAVSFDPLEWDPIPLSHMFPTWALPIMSELQ